MQKRNIRVGLEQSLSRVIALSPFKENGGPALSCAQMVGRKVFSAFFDAPFPKLMNALAKVDTVAAVTRQRVIRAGRNRDFLKVAAVIREMAGEEAMKLGNEFFLVTAKKAGKLGGVEGFAGVVKAVLEKMPYEKAVFKAFFVVERSGSECIDLLENLRNWEDFEHSELMFVRSFLISIEKLATQNKPLDMVCVFEYFANLGQTYVENQEEIKKMSLKALSILIGKLLSSREDPTLVTSSLDYLQKLSLRPSEIFFNKLLELVARLNGKGNEKRTPVISTRPSLLKNTRSENWRKSGGSQESLKSFVPTCNGMKTATQLYTCMLALEISPSVTTFNCMIEICSLNGDVDATFQHFASLLKSGLCPDHCSYGGLSRAIKRSDLSSRFKSRPVSILELYKTHAVPLSAGAFNSMVDIYIALDKPFEAQKVFQEMRSSAMVAPDAHTFSSLVKGACKRRELELALEYLRISREEFDGLTLSRVASNALMDLAVKQRRLDVCLKVFETMRASDNSPDAFSYSILLNGLKQGGVDRSIVQATLLSLQKIIPNCDFRLDEVFFNSILDVCCKFEFFRLMKVFMKTMKDCKLEGSHVTYGILIKAHTKQHLFTEAESLFSEMVQKGLRVNDVVYGSILDSCARSGDMLGALRIYDGLEKTGLNLNSIVFTTIIKGFMRAGQCQQAVRFFERVKHHTNLSGMIISYNCSLDALVQLNRIKDAENLFKEIETLFTADLVSYSTLIKGLCKNNLKARALVHVQKMLSANFKIDVSVVNLYLDFCAHPKDFKLGLRAWSLAERKHIRPNEVTFGILIKLYGFSRELNKAFALVEIMNAYCIRPSIIVFTNLVHISFYSRKLKRAELAFRLLKKQKLQGDRLLYSKLVDGFLRVKDKNRALKYLSFAHLERIPLRSETCDKLEEIISNSDSVNNARVQACRKFRHVRVAPQKANSGNNKKKIVSKVGEKKVRAEMRRGFVMTRKGFEKAAKRGTGRLVRRGFGTQVNGEKSIVLGKVGVGEARKERQGGFKFKKRRGLAEAN